MSESDQTFAMAIGPFFEQRIHVEAQIEDQRVTEASIDLSHIIDAAPHGYEEPWFFDWEPDTRVFRLRRGAAVRRFVADPEPY